MARKRQKKNRSGCGVLIGGIGILALCAYSSSLFEKDGTTNDNEDPPVEKVERDSAVEKEVRPIDVRVGRQTVKRVGGKHRYFFVIKNYDTRPFVGEVRILLKTGTGTTVGDETFEVQSPIQPNVAKSVYMDARTGPTSDYGDYRVVRFEYSVKGNGNAYRASSLSAKSIDVRVEAIKRVDDKYRYFFMIENLTDTDLDIGIKVQVKTEQGLTVGEWASDTRIPHDAPKIVYIDSRTGPTSEFGDRRVAGFAFRVCVDGRVVFRGAGKIN